MLDVAHSNSEFVVTGSNRTLRITKDLGGTWENILAGLPSNNMTYVAFDPLNENTVWVTFEKGDLQYSSTSTFQPKRSEDEYLTSQNDNYPKSASETFGASCVGGVPLQLLDRCTTVMFVQSP